MAVRLLSDSACDIPQSEAKKMNVTVLPLKTIIDGVEYLDQIQDLPSGESGYAGISCPRRSSLRSEPGKRRFVSIHRGRFLFDTLSGTEQSRQFKCPRLKAGGIFVILDKADEKKVSTMRCHTELHRHHKKAG